MPTRPTPFSPTVAALVAACVRAPDDRAARLVLADALEDDGEAEKAGRVRALVRAWEACKTMSPWPDAPAIPLRDHMRRVRKLDPDKVGERSPTAAMLAAALGAVTARSAWMAGASRTAASMCGPAALRWLARYELSEVVGIPAPARLDRIGERLLFAAASLRADPGVASPAYERAEALVAVSDLLCRGPWFLSQSMASGYLARVRWQRRALREVLRAFGEEV